MSQIPPGDMFGRWVGLQVLIFQKNRMQVLIFQKNSAAGFHLPTKIGCRFPFSKKVGCRFPFSKKISSRFPSSKNKLLHVVLLGLFDVPAGQQVPIFQKNRRQVSIFQKGPTAGSHFPTDSLAGSHFPTNIGRMFPFAKRIACRFPSPSPRRGASCAESFWRTKPTGDPCADSFRLSAPAGINHKAARASTARNARLIPALSVLPAGRPGSGLVEFVLSPGARTETLLPDGRKATACCLFVTSEP